MSVILQYAIQGVAYVLGKISEKEFESINAVYIFGSVARKIADAKSDVDVFFDAEKKSKNKSLRKKFFAKFEEYQLTTQGLKYQLAGVHNAFSPIVGVLEEWGELKHSIAVSGIQVYGSALISVKSKPWFVYSWEKSTNRGAFLNKLYGYHVKKKHYRGLLEKTGSLKLGKSTIAVPREHKNTIEQVLKKYNASYRIYEFAR